MQDTKVATVLYWELRPEHLGEVSEKFARRRKGPDGDAITTCSRKMEPTEPWRRGEYVGFERPTGAHNSHDIRWEDELVDELAVCAPTEQS